MAVPVALVVLYFRMYDLFSDRHLSGMEPLNLPCFRLVMKVVFSNCDLTIIFNED